MRSLRLIARGSNPFHSLMAHTAAYSFAGQRTHRRSVVRGRASPIGHRPTSMLLPIGNDLDEVFEAPAADNAVTALICSGPIFIQAP